MTNFGLTKDDCLEIFSALDDDKALMDRIGIDGENLARGHVADISTDDLASMRAAIEAKRARLAAGHYDDFVGECDLPLTTTGRWIAHLDRITDKLHVARIFPANS